MKIKKYYHIYKIINLINNKIYVGRHFGNIEDDYMGSGLLLNKAYKKYNIKNFKKELIEINDNLFNNQQREKYWIKKLNSFQPNGYNINEGGDGGDNLTKNPNYEKICKKIGRGVKIRNILHPEINKKQGEKIKGSNNGRWKGGICKIKQESLKLKKKLKFETDKELKIKILTMWNNRNLSKSDILNILNIGHSRFHRLVTELNLKKRKLKYFTEERRKNHSKLMKGKNNPRYIDGRCINQITKDNEQEFLKLYNNRIALHKICKQLNIGWSIIQKYIKEHNLSRKRPPTGRAAHKIVGAE